VGDRRTAEVPAKVNEENHFMSEVSVGDHQLLVHRGSLPDVYYSYRQDAALAEEIGLDTSEGEA
jgi:hypothetical protein